MIPIDILSKIDCKQRHEMSDQLIVIDAEDRPLGSKCKLDCHLMTNINNGLIHRGLSVLLFNSNNELLLTQRSDTKIVFPSQLANTCDAHPLYTPSEREETDAIGAKRAAQRRLRLELGIHIPIDDFLFMARFEYNVISDDIYGEHEVDYVFVVQRDVTPEPNFEEVQWFGWVSRDEIFDFISKFLIK